MSKKTFFILGIGYIAGNIASSMYASKKGSEVQKDLEIAKKQGDDTTKIIYDNVVDVNKNMFDDIKSCIFSDKNKKIFNEKKDELIEATNSLKEDAIEMYDDLKSAGKEKGSEAKKAVDDFYRTKKAELKVKFKNSKESLDEMEDKLEEEYEKLKRKVK